MTDALRIANNLAETMSHFARTEPAATVCERHGVRIVDVGAHLRVFNTAVTIAPLKDEAALRCALAAARDQFARSSASWSIWICGGLLPNSLVRAVPAIAAEYGLSRNSATPGMIASAIVPGPSVNGLEIRRIADAHSRTSFCRILSRVFEGPAEQLTQMYARERLWTNAFRGYVGSIGGEDVCAGFAVAAADSLGIYALATLPAFVRRGCASALIRHAAAESRALDGDLPLVLQAAEPGMRLYRRLGFRTATDFRLYSAP
jgi:GNAT superfamily N-acetyltransferase